MASRNNSKPRPRTPSTKNAGHDKAPMDKPRRVGVQRVAEQIGNGPRRQPFSSSSVYSRQNAASTTDTSSVKKAESSSVEFTKEKVEALLNEKMKANKYDLKKRLEQVLEHNKRFKLCVRWFQQYEDNLLHEQEKLCSSLELSKNKCNDTEVEMNAISSHLRKTIASLEEKLAMEQADNLDAINSHRREKEARETAEKLQASLALELEKARQEKLVADHRLSTSEDMNDRAQEYIKSLQQYNNKLQRDLETTSQSQSRLEMEKRAIVDNLSNFRVDNKALRDQLTCIKASRDSLLNEYILYMYKKHVLHKGKGYAFLSIT